MIPEKRTRGNRRIYEKWYKLFRISDIEDKGKPAINKNTDFKVHRED